MGALSKEILVMLKAIREKDKITQKELADKIGKSRPSITMIETGRVNLSVDYIQSFVEALGYDFRLQLMTSDETHTVGFVPYVLEPAYYREDGEELWKNEYLIKAGDVLREKRDYMKEDELHGIYVEVDYWIRLAEIKQREREVEVYQNCDTQRKTPIVEPVV